jgi:hypothetical protein
MKGPNVERATVTRRARTFSHRTLRGGGLNSSCKRGANRTKRRALNGRVRALLRGDYDEFDPTLPSSGYVDAQDID